MTNQEDNLKERIDEQLKRTFGDIHPAQYGQISKFLASEILQATYQAEQKERKIWFENEKNIRQAERERIKGLIKETLKDYKAMPMYGATSEYQFDLLSAEVQALQDIMDKLNEEN